jgi:arylsulfatase
LTRPNILWICSDPQRFDTIRALGNELINTPNLDRLANEGVAFTNAYCQNPLCQPSRANFLTGRYPRTTTVRQNGQEPWPDHEVLITKRLANAGYTCGLVGKLHISACQGRVEQRTDDGYHKFYWSHHPFFNKEWKGHHDYENWMLDQGVTPADIHESHDRMTRGVSGGFPEEYHQSRWCADRSIQFIDEADGPWCLSLNPFDPHHGFDPRYDYLKRCDADDMPDPAYVAGKREQKPLPHQVDARGAYGGIIKQLCYDEMTPAERRNIVAAYYAMIELLDHHIGRIIDHLDRLPPRDQRRRTL